MTRSGPDFDQLYRQDPDPWRVATSWYERRKLAILLACLRQPQYRLAWDPACGTGELAALLAPRCEAVVASDASVVAVDLTHHRLAGCAASHVTVVRSALPQAPSCLTSAPDLIVLSEVLYYLDATQRRDTAQLMQRVAGATTDIVAVHWRPAPEGSRLSGAAAQRELNDHLVEAGWHRVMTHTDLEFVLACWSRDVRGTPGH